MLDQFNKMKHKVPVMANLYTVHTLSGTLFVAMEDDKKWQHKSVDFFLFTFMFYVLAKFDCFPLKK